MACLYSYFVISRSEPAVRPHFCDRPHALLSGVECMKRRPLVSAVALFFVMVSVSFAAAPPQHESFLSNGVKIHYVTAGEGEPVILIHGFCANAQNNWVLPGVFAKLA